METKVSKETFLNLSSADMFTFVGEKMKTKQWDWQTAAAAVKAWKQEQRKREEEAMSAEEIEMLMSKND